MPWMVFLHIVFMSAWFGCLIALPRLFAEHAATRDPDLRAWYLTMEAKLFRQAMGPAGALTIASGFWLLFSHGFVGGWLPVKLLLVAVLALTHVYQGRVLANFRDGIDGHGPGFFHALSIVPTMVGSAIIVLVVWEPF